MHHHIPTRARSAALLATTGLLAALLVSAPAAPAATINACQKKKGGTIRIVGSKTKCKKTEKKIKWSTTGPAGTNGMNGVNGTNGASGANGTNGTNGAAGEPRKAYPFSVQSDFGLPAVTTPIVTIGDVSLRMSCAFFLAAFVNIEATGPSGTTSHTGMIVTRANGQDPPEFAQTLIQNDDVTTDTDIVLLTSNTTGVLTNRGHVTGTITSPTQVVLFTMNISVGPSAPDACTAKGSAIGIPR